MKKILFLLILVMSVISNAKNLETIYEKYRSGNYEKMTEEDAVEILKNADSIDGERVGYDNSVTLTRYAYKKIRNTENLLEKVFVESETNEGKVYALLGLWYLNKGLYNKYHNLIDLDSYIDVFPGGCIGSSVKIGDYLLNLNLNQYNEEYTKQKFGSFEAIRIDDSGWELKPRKINEEN